MSSSRLKTNYYVAVSVTLLILLQYCLGSPQRSSVQGRYFRPPAQDREYRKCTSGRCSESSDKSRDSHGYSDDGYKSERPGDFKPKDDEIDDGYTKPKDDYVPDAGLKDYNPDYKPVIKDEIIPKPDIRDDYDDKPVVRDEYKPKPPVNRDELRPKPIVRDEYDEKSIAADDYKPKPPVRVDYGLKPVNRDELRPKPIVRDEYDEKPIAADSYKPKPPVRVDYNSKPIDKDDYDVKPSVVDEFKPKPPVRITYNTRPIVRDEYDSESDVRGDEYGSKPVVRGDEYGSKPVVRGDGYGSKPVVRGDEYVPKPAIRDDYNVKPVEKVDYDRGQPAAGGGYYSSYPVKKDDDYKIAVGGVGSKDDDYNDDFREEGGVDGRPVPMADDGNCICVPYYQCKDGHIVTDGAGIIDARRRPQPDEDLPLDGKFKPPSCGPFHVCCNTPESSTVKPYEHRCGVRNPSGINSRILSPSNKGEADFGEWPWQAAVLKSEGSVNIFQCGGVLIDKYHVLTVAHCVFRLYKYNDYPLKVRLGEWDTQTTSEFLAHEDYKVSKITIHPEYRNTSLWNDIAILRLQDPVFFAPHIDTVCLPKYDENFAGQNCVVTGWGKDSYKGGTFSNVMKEVALQVIDNYNCEEMLRKTRLGRFFQLHEGFTCAGGEHGLDSCKGDGGGPLVCYRKDRSYALAGLVSWGIDCGQPGVPGVYVKIQKYLDWISKNTGVEVGDYWPKH